MTSTNNKCLNYNNHQKILFTAQMTDESKEENRFDFRLFFNMRKCYSLNTNNCSVHNLAKNIIALNEHKYIILIPKSNKINNIIIE